MMTDTEHIETLRQAILQDAKADADRILSQAAAEAQDTRRRAESRVTAEVRRLLRESREQSAATTDQTISRARLDAQMLKLQRREALLERVFARARDALALQSDRGDWPDTVRNLIKEAIDRLGGTSFTILADVDTRRALEGARISILAAELQVEFTMGAALESGTGVIVLTGDGRRRYDNTLEARLARIQDELRASVYRIVTGGYP